jgi:hypothetical protein
MGRDWFGEATRRQKQGANPVAQPLQFRSPPAVKGRSPQEQLRRDMEKTRATLEDIEDWVVESGGNFGAALWEAGEHVPNWQFLRNLETRCLGCLCCPAGKDGFYCRQCRNGRRPSSL